MITDVDFIKELLKEFLPPEKKIEHIKPYSGLLPKSDVNSSKKVLFFGDFNISKDCDLYLETTFNSNFINLNYNSSNLKNIFALTASLNSENSSKYQFIGYKIQLI